MKLSNKIFFNAKQFAHQQYIDSALQQKDNADLFVARCWFNAFLQALIKDGYKVCIEKDSEKFYLEDQ